MKFINYALDLGIHLFGIKYKFLCGFDLAYGETEKYTSNTHLSTKLNLIYKDMCNIVHYIVMEVLHHGSLHTANISM